MTCTEHCVGTPRTGCGCPRSASSSTAPPSTSWRSAGSSWTSTCARCWATLTSAVRCRPVHALHAAPGCPSHKCCATDADMLWTFCLIKSRSEHPQLAMSPSIAFGLSVWTSVPRAAGTKDVWEFLSAWSEVYGTEENTSLLKAMGHSLDAARTNVRRFAGDVGKVCGDAPHS